ncbi:MAG: hypothetical protein CM1200mP32_11700 [Methanobacteriota archaeon]|nr:MAG: hypothetical protein CM1200mP32_11700 [Euryarchaeota archaeon]
MDGNVAVLCAANMHINPDEGDLQRSMDRVVIGDGSDAEGAITEYWNSLREAGTRAHPPVAMYTSTRPDRAMLRVTMWMRWRPL